jgi:hypothetical protein
MPCGLYRHRSVYIILDLGSGQLFRLASNIRSFTGQTYLSMSNLNVRLLSPIYIYIKLRAHSMSNKGFKFSKTIWLCIPLLCRLSATSVNILLSSSLSCHHTIVTAKQYKIQKCSFPWHYSILQLIKLFLRCMYTQRTHVGYFIAHIICNRGKMWTY